MQSGVTPGEFASRRAFRNFVRNVPQFQVYLAMLRGKQNVSKIGAALENFETKLFH